MVERTSPWERKLEAYEALEGARRSDVVIIGAGIAGAACAYEFSSRGYTTVLLEKGQIGYGASGAGTGILIPEDGGIYFLAEPEELTERDAVYSWQVNREMQDSLYETLDRIGVEYRKTGALALGLYRDPDRESVMQSMRNEDELRRRFGLARVEVLTPMETSRYINSSRIALALHYPEDEVAAVSPVEMLEGLVRNSGAEVYTGSEVLKVMRSGKNYEVLTDGGCVTARKVIVATHGMVNDVTLDLPGHSVGDFVRPRYAHVISIRLNQNEREKIGLPSNESLWVENYEDSYNYMRIAGGLFLIGGEEGRVTARTPNPERTSQRRYTRLRDQFLELFPQLSEHGITMRRVENQWNSFISYSKNRRDRLPMVEYADGGDVAIIHSVTAAGLVKSITISKLLADLMEERPLYSLPKYADLIDARRHGRF